MRIIVTSKQSAPVLTMQQVAQLNGVSQLTSAHRKKRSFFLLAFLRKVLECSSNSYAPIQVSPDGTVGESEVASGEQTMIAKANPDSRSRRRGIKFRKGLILGVPYFLHNSKGAKFLDTLPRFVHFKTKKGSDILS